ncbi:MAG: hypothetical protein OXG53_10780 [Chloroflexi bacterium]|nr:hypothetical protein [Chloroflexota bacterium]
MRRIIDSIRDHCHFIAVIALLIVVMTFPTIVYVFNTEVFWLPTGNHPDTWTKSKSGNALSVNLKSQR